MYFRISQVPFIVFYLLSHIFYMRYIKINSRALWLYQKANKFYKYEEKIKMGIIKNMYESMCYEKKN